MSDFPLCVLVPILLLGMMMHTVNITTKTAGRFEPTALCRLNYPETALRNFIDSNSVVIVINFNTEVNLRNSINVKFCVEKIETMCVVN